MDTFFCHIDFRFKEFQCSVNSVVFGNSDAHGHTPTQYSVVMSLFSIFCAQGLGMLRRLEENISVAKIREQNVSLSI